MSDIVKWLREPGFGEESYSVRMEAAAEIERLRAENAEHRRRIAKPHYLMGFHAEIEGLRTSILAASDMIERLRAELAAERERWEQGIRHELSAALAEEVITAIRRGDGEKKTGSPDEGLPTAEDVKGILK